MKKTHKLSVKNLSASAGATEILHDIRLSVKSGSISAIMGPNGSGKSTLAHVLSGDPAYLVADGSEILLDKQNITQASPDERSKAGLFLAFQTPIAIPGVSVMNVLRSALADRNPHIGKSKIPDIQSLTVFLSDLKKFASGLKIKDELLNRGIHDGFSGGERKKIEILEALVLKPKFAVFDEIDTGLDIDALNVVSDGIRSLVKTGCGIILITHYTRILEKIKPETVYVMSKGKIVQTGNFTVAQDIDTHGYAAYSGNPDTIGPIPS